MKMQLVGTLNNKLYLNTMAIELMCFYKYSKNIVKMHL